MVVKLIKKMMNWHVRKTVKVKKITTDKLDENIHSRVNDKNV